MSMPGISTCVEIKASRRFSLLRVVIRAQRADLLLELAELLLLPEPHPARVLGLARRLDVLLARRLVGVGHHVAHLLLRALVVLGLAVVEVGRGHAWVCREKLALTELNVGLK